MSFIIDGNVLVRYVDDDELDVVVPKEIETIGREAFEESNVRSVSLPDSVRKIDYYAFSSCEDLRYIHLGCNVEQIMDSAFEWCYSLESIEFPKSVTYIGKCAFHMCESLKRILIPERVETICDSAFSECISLSEVVLQHGVKEIQSYAFVMCSNLKKIMLPSSIEHVESNAFNGDPELEEISVNGYSMYYTSEEGVLYRSKKEYLVRCPPAKKEICIPETVLGFSNDAFKDCRQIKNISIPASVGLLDTTCFSSCLNLESITVDENNKKYCSINGALYNKDKTSLIFCPPKIKEISIPDTVKRIEDNAFEECRLIRSVILPDGLEYIGHSAFSGCSNLVDLIIPKSVTDFGEGAFFLTPWLDKQREKDPLVIVNNVVIDGRDYKGKVSITEASKIGSDAFLNSPIEEITFSNQVEYIGKGAFYLCYNLRSLIIPDSVLEIGRNAFEACVNLETVYIPEDLLCFEVYNDWFDKYNIITNIKITHRENKRIMYDSIDGAVYEFDDNGQPTELIICPPGKCELYIPNGVKSIAPNAFCSCEHIMDLHLPDTLSFKNTMWYDKLCESKMYAAISEVNFFCSRESEAYKFAKENNINVVIDENSSDDNNTEN